MVAFIATCLPEHRRLPDEIRDRRDVFREKRDSRTRRFFRKVRGAGHPPPPALWGGKGWDTTVRPYVMDGHPRGLRRGRRVRTASAGSKRSRQSPSVSMNLVLERQKPNGNLFLPMKIG